MFDGLMTYYNIVNLMIYHNTVIGVVAITITHSLSLPQSCHSQACVRLASCKRTMPSPPSLKMRQNGLSRRGNPTRMTSGSGVFSRAMLS